MGKGLRISLVEDCLALSGPVNGGVAMVHSRKLKGQTVVSTQSFVVNNSYLATSSSPRTSTTWWQSM